MYKLKRFTSYFFRLFFCEYPLHLVMVICAILPQTGFGTRIRGILVRPFIGSCGKNFRIATGVIINNPRKLKIGDNVYIAHYAWINATGGLIIKSGSIVGPFSVIATSRHLFFNNRVTHNGYYRPVIIGEGVWLASHVVVTDGTTIGNGVLAAAGAVITHDIPDNSMVGGVPGKVIGAVRNG
ncbi:MAG: acyltransferase [Lentisphaeria bacterium]|jgi:acetyltransferase-like isoleucine patch superfamily enzyme